MRTLKVLLVPLGDVAVMVTAYKVSAVGPPVMALTQIRLAPESMLTLKKSCSALKLVASIV